MAVGKHREIPDVQQSQKIAPFTTRETLFGQQTLRVCFWCQHIWFVFWVSKLILSNNRSNATLWVLDTCLIIGLRPLMIILITASLSSKMYSWDSPWGELAFVVTWSRFDNWSTFWLPSFCILMLDMCKQFPAASLNPLFPETYWVEDFVWFDESNTSITTSHKSIAKNTVHSSTSIQRKSIRFCGTVRHLKFVSCTSNWWWRMFDFRKYIRCHPKLILSPQGLFASKIWVLKKTQSALLSCITHMTENVSIRTCENGKINLVNRRNEPCQSQVSNSCQKQAFQDYLWANF